MTNVAQAASPAQDRVSESPSLAATLRGKLSGLSHGQFVCLAAAVAFLLVFYFQSPRFVLWQGLEIAAARSNPEVNRAHDTLNLIASPFSPVPNSSNTIIQWRLLFPLLGHYLHFPRWLNLTVPFIGAFACAAAIAHFITRKTGDRLIGFGAAVAGSAASWFFVSTGWLCYYDAWYVAGLLSVAFSPSRRLLVLCGLLVPWIDERFVLGLPVAVLCRWALQAESPVRARWREVAALGCALLPWMLIRSGIVLAGVDRSESMVHPGHPYDAPSVWANMPLGVWHGFRGLWFYALILPWALHRNSRRNLALVIGAAVIATFAATTILAGDISRSVSMFLPLPIAGIAYLAATNRRLLLVSLPLVAAFNLAAPASHVMTAFTIPIYDLRHEILSYKNPPPEVNPRYHNGQGLQLLKEGKTAEATRHFDAAIKLAPQLPASYANRGYLRSMSGDPAGALADLDRAVKLGMQSADLLLFRGTLQLQCGQRDGARNSFQQALRVAPADWPKRGEVEVNLKAM